MSVRGVGSKEQMLAAFRRFDDNQDGTINAEELAKIFATLGMTCDASLIFAAVDDNNDGLIDYEEFTAWIFADESEKVDDPFLHVFKNLSAKCALRQTPAGFVSDSDLAPVVFIHGIFGSYLTRSGGSCWRHGFLTAAQAAGIRGSDISLPLYWDSGRQLYQDNPYVATGCIEAVAGFGLYKPLFDWLASLWGSDFHPFAYDWRRDNNESADLFIKFLESVVAGSGGRSAIVIAHSNGGLITMAALNEVPHLVHSVVFCAPALSPGPAFLYDMTYGKPCGGRALAPKVLSATALCSHPSYYSFLAGHPEAAGGGYTHWAQRSPNEGESIPIVAPTITNTRGEELNLMDPDVWHKYKLGALWKSASTADDNVRLAHHLGHVCSAVERFRLRTAPSAHGVYPPLRVVAAKNIPTLTTLVVEDDGNVRPGDGPNAFTPGDGRVPWRGAFPGGGLSCVAFESQGSHSTIVSDLAAISAALLQNFRERQASVESVVHSTFPYKESLQEALKSKSGESRCVLL